LAYKGPLLRSDALATLNQKMLMHPSARIGETYWSVIELLHQTLVDLRLDGLEGQELAVRQRNVLNLVELLMHRCAALNDYLGKLLQALLTAKGEGGAEKTKERMDVQINRLYKIPINFVKHNSFTLSWVRMSQGNLYTHGYMVTGSVGGDVHGPIKFRRPGGDDSEGYSFALSLREVLPALYKMCDCAEDSLTYAGLFVEQDAPARGRDVRADLLPMALELLNQLPFYGFPDEDGARVPIFHVIDEAVMVTTSPLCILPGAFRIESELRSVQAGASYKLPYWKPDATHR
jgi:hypothetical protein